ncbi:Sodium channel protein type 11 subunit alpha (NaN) (Sensory neuron sodium channel 2) (Sodium channel protein type XI subunit alpha) (Voltage-gated sodium channel subunit alpha Nav1.9) [Durusdinium trenchii]|uniref:Sodium channel protein type 11 subunit alpha (NaN) (Sensory neuron sodium channel 2) (Sodium channel protein type XI subunit alpha) (Voltage-gated sodium channel subunit alpha Nav1.9) n=1 Tax=Durusdinium trenchii TaxID=1381693 RepID=A0ABP0PN22_9DINO
MRSQVFIYGIMFVIMFNLISLGIEVDLAAKNGQEDVPEIFDYMNLIVVIIFVFELAVNVTANGVYKFVCGGDCLWNFFDVIIVALSAFETGISFLSGSTSTSQGVSPSHLRFMRPIRLARALRGVRVTRLFRYVGALRTLLLSIMSSIASLFWTIVLLLLLFYSFGVLLTQLVSDFCRAEAIAATDNPNAIPDCSNFEHRRYWQSVPEAMLTLFMAISGGIDWDDALIPLRNLDDVASTAAVTALILYIVITVPGIRNNAC